MEDGFLYVSVHLLLRIFFGKNNSKEKQEDTNDTYCKCNIPGDVTTAKHKTDG